MSNHYEYTPSHIANFFLEKKDHDIDNLKLNKIVYISLGFSLALLNKDIFNEEVQAWKYGPVIPSLFHEFKHCGKNTIRKQSTEYSYSKNKKYNPVIDKQDLSLKDVLSIVWKLYKNKTGAKLIELTHGENTPWSMSKSTPIEWNTIIPKELIKKYYKIVLNID